MNDRTSSVQKIFLGLWFIIILISAIDGYLVLRYRGLLDERTHVYMA